MHANVRAGVAAYRAGDYQAATTAFEASHQLSPEDHRILFDLGCTAAAKKEWQKAITYLQQATFAADSELTTKAHYNLGGVATDRAKTIFGSPVEEADESARRDGMAQIATAIGHYRDCLALQSDHTQARRNLELLRSWSKHIGQIWEEQDRQKRRNDLDLAKFLDWLQAEQRVLRQTTNRLATTPSSPKQRYSVRKLSATQKLLVNEVPFLQRKIQEELNKAAQGQGIDANQLAQSISYLHSLTIRASDAMVAAQSELQNQNADAALANQTDSLDRLNELFLTLSPFQQVLQKAIQRQEKLVKLSASKDSRSSTHSSAKSIAKSTTKSSTILGGESSPLDIAEQARRQERITQWARALSAKATQHLEEQPAASTIGPTPDPNSDEARQAEQLKAVRAMYEKAIENSPAIQATSDHATEFLEQNDPTLAQPQQEEALRLLKEISQQAPPQQDEQNKDNQKDNQEENEQNKDQQDQDQNGDDKQQDGQQDQDGDKGQDDKNKESNDKDKSEEGDEKNDNQQNDPTDEKEQQENQRDKQTQNDKEKDGDNDKQNTNQSRSSEPQKMSQEQVESLLRKVRQREQMRRELERRLKAIIGGSVPVERDW